MKIKFKEFLNEYGGRGRAAGFRYSEPTKEYGFSVPILFESNIDINDIRDNIEKILKEENVEEDYFKFEKLSNDEIRSIIINNIDENDYFNYKEMFFEGLTSYLLEISMKAYSKYELRSMISIVTNRLSKIYNKEMLILIDRINIKGDDFDGGMKKVKGFRK